MKNSIKKSDLVQLRDPHFNKEWDELPNLPYGKVLVIFNNEALVLFRSSLTRKLTTESDIYLRELSTKWVCLELLEYVKDDGDISIITPWYHPLGPMGELELERISLEFEEMNKEFYLCYKDDGQDFEKTV